ncbi:MAG: hypothetical protein ABW046_20185 [Actinoplanes sp.]
MKDWTIDDSNALFKKAPNPAPDEEQTGAPDGSEEAMRRMRFPFEVNPADAFEQQQEVPGDEDDYRR